MQTLHFFHSGTLQYWFQSSLKSNNFVDDKKKYGSKQYWCKPQRVTTAYSKEPIFDQFWFLSQGTYSWNLLFQGFRGRE